MSWFVLVESGLMYLQYLFSTWGCKKPCMALLVFPEFCCHYETGESPSSSPSACSTHFQQHSLDLKWTVCDVTKSLNYIGTFSTRSAVRSSMVPLVQAHRSHLTRFVFVSLLLFAVLKGVNIQSGHPNI